MAARAKNKRPNNEGSIRQRPDGRWEARYVAGTKSDGSPLRRSVYGDTQEEVSKKLLEVRKQLEDGLYVEPIKITISSWLDTWLKVYVMPTKRNNTIGAYKNVIDRHIKPEIGAIKLQKLRTDHVQAALNAMTAKGIAPATVIKAKNVLHGALKQAVINNLLPRNVSEGVAVPKLEQEDVNPLTPDEQRRFLEALPATTTGRALAFILRTGLRVGELCGLRWKDIDGDFFEVRQTIRRTPIFDQQSEGGDVDKKPKTSLQTGKPKTVAGKRQVPISEKALAVLDDQRRAQVEMRLKAGSTWANNGLIFSADNGNPLEVRNISRTLYKVLEQIGASRRGVHALRHTFATRWIEAGNDVRTLADILGHANVATTLKLYVHSSKDTKRRGMDALDKFI